MDHQKYFDLAAKQALFSTCKRSKCGSVIVYKGRIIGKGCNSPPGVSICRCLVDKNTYDKKITDKTCCIHAEQRAIIDTLTLHDGFIYGSTLYFIRLDKDNNPKPSGMPYCTICSKMALDVGIRYFALMHKDGPKLYPTDEYNELSFNYKSS
jgi:deoxycytidylate deaminase